MPEDIDDQNDDDLVPRSHIRELEAQAKESRELKAQLAQMERDSAFAKALGPAADSPGAKYFVKAYDGELTVDAIKAAATEGGFLQTSQPVNAPSPPDLSGHQRIADASAGATSPAQMSWQDELATADRITNQAEREAAILTVVEKHGGYTSRNTQ